MSPLSAGQRTGDHRDQLRPIRRSGPDSGHPRRGGLTAGRHAMPLCDDIRGLADQVLSRVNEAREFYVHSRQAWRLVQQLARKGRPVGIVTNKRARRRPRSVSWTRNSRLLAPRGIRSCLGIDGENDSMARPCYKLTMTESRLSRSASRRSLSIRLIDPRPAWSPAGSRQDRAPSATGVRTGLEPAWNGRAPQEVAERSQFARGVNHWHIVT